MPSDDQMRCRVCGLLQDDPPWGADGRTPSFELCECCGTEFGYEDATQAGVERARARWAASGYVWAEPTSRPVGWDPQDQLTAAGIRCGRDGEEA